MQATRSRPVLKVALPVPLRQFFDYLAPVGDVRPYPGQRVVVTFGKRKMTGVITEVTDRSELPLEKLSPVLGFPDGEQAVLDRNHMSLLEWCWHYYKHAPGEVIFSALPPLLRKPDTSIPPESLRYQLTEKGEKRLGEPPGRIKAQIRMLEALRGGSQNPQQLRRLSSSWRQTLQRLQEHRWVEARPAGPATVKSLPGPELLPEQAEAVESIGSELDGFHCHLLDGITGSGKTEVYLRLIERVLARGQQVLLLVPEIGLTPQLVRRFEERLGFEPGVTHSGLSEGQRLKVWANAKRGISRLVIGTRSALFLPSPNLGLIILDEEHDASFKQQDGFRYSSRDVAVKRASVIGVPIVLGSATPSLETFCNAVNQRYHWHRLRQRATGAEEPRWRVLDLLQQTMTGGIAKTAMEAIGDTLGRGEQVLVFLNRRGYAPVVLCHTCGWHASCGRCDANLTWHRGSDRLLCHHCGSGGRLPRFCPECGADALQGAGEGTEQLEQVLDKAFADVPLFRFDADTVRRKGEFNRLSERVREGGACILVGTQMLAKGHHFPRVTLVVIVNLDQALHSADFRALERMGQLMVQVAGRAGRDELPGEVILQTHYPQHEMLHTLLSQGYEAFARSLFAEREMTSLPPFSFQALLRCDAFHIQEVRRFLDEARVNFPPGPASVYGPFPAMMERRSGRVRWYLLVQAARRPPLHQQLDEWVVRLDKLPSARKVRWALDVDPQEY